MLISISGKRLHLCHSPLKRQNTFAKLKAFYEEIEISEPPLVQVADRQWTTSIACPSRPASLLPGTRGHHQDTPADLALEDTEAGRTSNDLIRQQLSRMLDSSTFVQSEKLSRFLRFVVEHVIDGNPGSLKEYVIGVEVYDRKPPYHPSLDSIVRTEARRLRGKLKEYYQGEGQEDPVYIYLRPGSYIPVFQHRKDLIGTRGTALAEATTLDKPSSVAIAILPFRDISENSLSMTFARGIPDELGYALMKTSGCTVVSPSILARGNNQEHDIGGAMSQFKSSDCLRGKCADAGNTPSSYRKDPGRDGTSTLGQAGRRRYRV